MNRLNMLGCPPMPAFKSCQSKPESEASGSRKEGSDSDSFDPDGTRASDSDDEASSRSADAAALKKKTKKKKKATRRRREETDDQVPPPPTSRGCPCFQQMEVVPGLWYQLEDASTGKRAWHWIGNPVQAWSVLVPLSAVPLGPSGRPRTPPPLQVLHMAVFPAGLYHSMVRDSNLVLCMVIAPPPHSVGAWYSIHDDGDKEDVDVTVGSSSSCDPWYTLPASGTSTSWPSGCWIWFPVPPDPAADNTISVSATVEESDVKLLHLTDDEDSLVLGRWMTDTLTSA